MDIKQRLTVLLRRILPSRLAVFLKRSYRKLRVRLVSLLYGSPAKRLKVIAVTGTNGKTTTTNYLNEVFKAAGFKTAMFSTAVIEQAGQRRLNDLNMSVASVATMQRFFRDAVRDKADYVILEVTSHSLYQHKLDGVPIDTAIMTNLTQDHLDYHGTMERYASIKGMLFARKPKYIVLNRDDEWYDYFSRYAATSRRTSYGESSAASVRYAMSEQNVVRFSAAPDIAFDATLKLPGSYNAANAAAAVAAALLHGIDPAHIVQGIENLPGVPGRYEHIAAGRAYDIVIDYAHTPDALTKLLTTARDMTRGSVRIVFGATGDRDRGKRPQMGEIASRLTDKVYLTDDESYSEDPAVIRSEVLAGVPSERRSLVTEIDDRKTAIATALKEAQPGDLVLITGMGHEQFRIAHGKRLPWNDGAVVRELLDFTDTTA